MYFSEMQEVSFQDYPSKISTIVWTKGCNKKCWYCLNPKLISKIHLWKRISENKVINFIQDKNKYQKWIDAIVICGGEPTIQKGLEGFLYRLRMELPDLKIKLDTNGINPKVLEELIKLNLIDYIAMDVKIDEFYNIDYLRSVEIVKKFMKQKDGKFRWTLHPGCFTTKERFLQIFKDSKRLYLQKFSRKMPLLKDNNMKEYTFSELNLFKKEIENNFKECKTRW